VKSLAVSPLERNTLYAGTRPAKIYASYDAGATWCELKGFRKIRSRRFWFSPAGWPFTAYVQAIALSPTDPEVVLAGVELGAVVRSEDGGETWTEHRPGSLRDCHSLIFHSVDSDWAYEGGGTGAGVAFSSDGGVTWEQPREGLDRHYGRAVAAAPADPEIWYASLSPGPGKAHGDDAEAFIFRSIDGDPWEKLGGGLPQPLKAMPYALITHETKPDTLYAGLSDGNVWESPDRGDSWQRLPFNLGRIDRKMIIV
jgi:hypothetical protein